MRKHIIAYFMIIVLLTGCSAQSIPKQVDTPSTYTENNTLLESISSSTSHTNTENPSKPIKSDPNAI
ncbi:hypothetical protein [Ruminiclostridium cellobioparum]|uniref:Uncharacterized protein n=1 Tax=Ruminiclostridium cellobioparum subsp. termitidis CT1112 TaxID=1195236 RepID=S0FJF3_RUMCE|nr:hypothetical protein [Ruminiclostridium cellobioparum]EMS72270.1 hypothetical protein CTER_1775 [Ruminiclostridium cellobioparum subsp. termitidis CT1112]